MALDLDTLVKGAKLVGALSGSSKKTTTKSTAKSSGTGDLAGSLLASLTGAVKSTKAAETKKETAEADAGVANAVKGLASLLKKDTAVTKDSSTSASFLKALLSTKTEDSETAEITTTKNELSVLKSLLGGSSALGESLTKASLTTIVKKVISTLVPAKQTTANVVSALSSFNGIDLNAVKSIATKLIGDAE